MLLSEGMVLDKVKVANDAITTVRRTVTDITVNFCSSVPATAPYKAAVHDQVTPFPFGFRRRTSSGT